MTKFLFTLLVIVSPYLMLSQSNSNSFIEYKIGLGPSNIPFNNINSDDSQALFKFKVKSSIPYYELKVNKIPNSSEILIYSTMSNLESNSPLLQKQLKEGEIIKISSEEIKGDFCFVKVEHQVKDLQSNINLKITPSSNEPCDYFKNKSESFERPAIINSNLLHTRYEGCNSGSSDFVNNKYNFLGRPKSVKWIESSLQGERFISFDIISSELKNANFILFFIKNNKEYLIDHNAFSRDKKYAVGKSFKKFKIGIYSKTGHQGNFILNVKHEHGKPDCINFNEQGDSLAVVSTSLGSPLDGPFQAGEIIEYSYKLMEWHPINNNWLHCFIPEFGEGWDKEFSDSLLQISEIFYHNEIFQKNSIKQNTDDFTWLNKDSFKLKENITIENGWYLSMTDYGPKGKSPKSRWGKTPDVYEGSFEKPLIEIRFKLKTIDSIPNCAAPPSCSVKVTPFSDFEKGSYSVEGCQEMPSSEVLSSVKCCDHKPILLNETPLICSNEKIDISLNTFNNFDCKIEGPNETTVVKSTNLPTFLVNDSTEIITYKFHFYTTDNETCMDTSLYTEVQVAPSPIAPIIEDISACKGEIINIELSNTNELNTYSWSSLKNKFKHNLQNNGLSQTFKLHNKDEINIRVVNQFECIDSTIVNIELEDQCDKEKSNSFQASFFPNPTNGYLVANISGLSNSSSKLIFLNGNLQFVHQAIISNGQNELDVSFLDAGIYFVKVINEDDSFVEKLTIIND